MRRPVIAGNWKMHKDISETTEFIKQLLPKLQENKQIDIIICPPFTSIETAVNLCKNTQIKVAAQNMHWEEKGAFTGEISPGMLVEMGVEYCIIGHSERRQYFGESDDAVNRKVKAAILHKITPIICFGETLEEREAGKTINVVENQVKKALEGLDAWQVANLILAYEPIWAIGTGKTASAADAQEVIGKIREMIRLDFGQEAASNIRIQYGGSVKPGNIQELMKEKDIDGALVGGASLETDSFLKLINY